MTRADHFLDRVDRELATIEPAAREALLTQLIDHWEHRYATCSGLRASLSGAPIRTDPISAHDFVLTLVGLAARQR